MQIRCRGSTVFRRLGRNCSLVQVVVNALYRIVDVIGKFLRNLNVFLLAYVSQMTAYKCIEVISEEFIKDLEVFVEIRSDIKTLKRSVARSYAVDRHQKFGLRNIDEEVAFMGVVEMARQFDGFASERDRLFRLKVTFGNNLLGSFISFRKAATLSSATICRPLMSLNAAEPPM